MPIPTLPVDGKKENEPLEVDIDGVVPVNLKALLFPDRVKVENVGVPEVVISWAAFKVTEEPKETNPPPVNPVPAVTVRDELLRYELRIDPLSNDNPEVTVNDPPIDTLPEVAKVDRVEWPDTLSPFNAPNPVIDPPTPTLPVVTKDEAVMPVVDNPPLARVRLVVVNDAPTPTLPVDETVNAVDPDSTWN